MLNQSEENFTKYAKHIQNITKTGLGSSVECVLEWLSGAREFAAPVRHHSLVEIAHATVILSLPLIQEGKLSVTCERMCTEYWLTA